MRMRWLLSIVIVAAALTSGCGTIVNLNDNVAQSGMNGGRREVYGGVRWDIEEAWPLGQPVASHNTFWPNLPRFFFFLIDLPASAIADTITLPYTVANAFGFSFGSTSRYEYAPVTFPPPPPKPIAAMNPRTE